MTTRTYEITFAGEAVPAIIDAFEDFDVVVCSGRTTLRGSTIRPGRPSRRSRPPESAGAGATRGEGGRLTGPTADCDPAGRDHAACLMNAVAKGQLASVQLPYVQQRFRSSTSRSTASGQPLGADGGRRR